MAAAVAAAFAAMAATDSAVGLLAMVATDSHTTVVAHAAGASKRVFGLEHFLVS